MTGIRIFFFVSSLLFVMWTMRQAAGRLAPKVGIAGILFLISRPAVLVVWALGAAGLLALLLPGAVAKGHDSVGDFVLLSGISLMCGFGLSALVVGPVFMAMRAFVPKPVFELEPGEKVWREMMGSHYLRGEGRGGHVLLTNRRLAFRPHRFNVQLDVWSMPLAEIEQVVPEGTRFLVVTTAGAKEPEWLVVPGAVQVSEEIRAGMGR